MLFIIISSIRITEVFPPSSGINPVPNDDGREEMDGCGPLHQSMDVSDHFLSPNKLRFISGVNELSNVMYLELSVDTSTSSLGNFGSYLPHLSQLRLYDSYIQSIRDLGTSLNLVKVVWMARCNLRDLDGLAALPCLQEFYIAHNNVSDISLMSLLTELQILDIEQNFINDKDQLGYLSLCPSLRILTLHGNPITHNLIGYREMIHQLIPQLEALDDVHYHDGDNKPIDTNSLMSPSMIDGWRDVIKGNSTSIGPLQLHEKSRNKSSVTGNDDREGSSDLTHGVGGVMCGNPVRALRARKNSSTTSNISFASTSDLHYIRPHTASSSGSYRMRRYHKSKDMMRSQTAMPTLSTRETPVSVGIATHKITLPRPPTN
jgi:hypothetical protein